MIYTDQTFWCYLCNESQFLVDQVKTMLTKTYYDFDTKKKKLVVFYQPVNRIQINTDIYETIRFPSGLIKYITDKLPIEIDKKERIERKFSEEEVVNYANIVKGFNKKFEVRDYQIEAAISSLNRFQSLIYSSVGSGKTSVMSLVCKILSNDRILIMNGNNFILQQIYERLLSFDITDVSWNPSKEPDYTKRIVLINTKSSDERLNRKDENYLTFLKSVNTWIIDECQHFQALTAFEPWFYMDENNLHRVIGYSGSPFRNYEHPYNNEDDFVLISLLGEPCFTYTMKDSINDENIAQPYSYFINYPIREAWLPEHLRDNYFIQYGANITHNKARNRAGIELLKYLNKYKIKTLASINNIKPGQNLMKTLKEEGVKSKFICGDNTIYEWIPGKKGKLKLEKKTDATTNDIKKAFDEGYNIIFGSTVLDEGVDIEEFQAVVLFSAGKTPIAGIQRLGRCSRKKKSGKNISFVIDFKDVGGNYMFQSHYEQRKKMMKDSGVINIEKVQDFCKMIQEMDQ